MDISSVQQNGKMGRSPSHKRCTSEQQNDSVPNRRCSTPVEHKHETAEDVEKAVAGSMVEESASISFKQLKFTEDSTKSDFPPGDGATGNNLIKLGQRIDDVSKNPGLEQLGQAQENGAKSPSQLGEISLTSSVSSTRLLPKKRKDNQRLSSGSTRLLRSRSQEKSKAPEPSNNLAEEKGVDIEKKRKKKKRTEKSQVNEFSRIRTHLRYLLHRIKYEQNFIDAYSGEGWKGQSLEKIKPKRELQRAKSEIFRRKLKIRDLFQRLDLSCAEGRIPEALFDSEGEIDSEDIFCAKCGSKDETINNDIILCDGACERGFHQFCLEPPLLKEHIPPDGEGWLCPGCDCKVDCIDLLNDAQGTDLSVIDSWEKVFPEEAAAAARNKLDDNLGLPSDDSEDDDYDPDGPELDENEMVQSDESSSDESDNSSASDDLGALPNNEQTLGLPSDDSEDDDYDPSSLDPDQEVKQESSSSDFTSDSEDFSVAFGDDKPSGEVQGPTTKSNKERGGQNEAKRELINEELVSILESDSGRGDSGSIYPKRHIERLDYKKLHDEEYGNTSSDSSDEDYLDVDIASPKKRKSSSPKAASVSPNGETPIANHGKDSSNIEQNQIEIECTGKKRTRKKKIDVEGIPATQCKDSSAPGTSGIGTPKSREAATQRLLESFKESQYPTRDVKENLARELPLTVQQISKWFENTRWSYRHSSHKKSKVDGITSNKNTSPQKTEKLSEPEPELVSRDDTSNGVEVKKRDVKLNMVKVEGNGEKSSTPKSRKRKAKFDNQETGPNTSTKETAKQNAEVSSPKTQGARKSSRLQLKSTKSVS